MKKLFFTFSICFFAMTLSVFAQNDKTFRLHAIYPNASGAEIKESYSDGDSITTEYFKKCAIKLLSNGKDVWKKQGDPFLDSYEIFVYYKGSVMQNKNVKSWAGIQNKYAEMPEKITIAWIKGFKMVDGKKVTFNVPNITLYRAVGPKNKKASGEFPQ